MKKILIILLSTLLLPTPLYATNCNKEAFSMMKLFE